jgi:biopolymer transport protein ExbD
MRRRRKATTFEVVPMIDVFMIITLFLMVMAFLPQISDSLKAELPSSQTAEKSPPSMVVQLTKDGAIRFQDQVVEPAILQAKLQEAVKAKPDTAIIIAADKNIAYEKVVTLIDQLKTSGIKRLALATAPQGQ